MRERDGELGGRAARHVAVSALQDILNLRNECHNLSPQQL